MEASLIWQAFLIRLSMGTDDLYKKRKARKIKKSGDLMVIICEGQKSEPNYISEFIKDFKSNRNLNKIKILPNHYTDPLNIVQQAVELKKDGYDIVACVFDKDTHANFSNAIELARKKNIKTIISDPCFEFWILLHFKNTSRPFGGGTPCQDCIKELKKIPGFNNYQKGKDNIYSMTKMHINTATQRAKKLQSLDSSKTNFFELLDDIKEFLQSE